MEANEKQVISPEPVGMNGTIRDNGGTVSRSVLWSDLRFLLSVYGDTALDGVRVLVDGNEAHALTLEFRGGKLRINLHVKTLPRASE